MKNNRVIVLILARMYDKSDRRRNEVKGGEGGINSWWLKLIAKQ